ncbi:hypothetical protein LAZ67_2000508 [Cordylochernes scorpioides]|uniref:Amino acid transporter transmembrane domain-containing protein n=1 Tax=Cordylochernes scorpioides TaxID=51811 RepID=A0ABY6K0I0_9ARAC|nr:hypothetical protein LAZ67_2000508 [Cordylochernes scorpioides]
MTDSPTRDEEKNVTEKKKKGLSLILTVIFIVAEMSGAGMMAFPLAFTNSGWLGVGMLIWYCFNAAYTGILLGRCWIILEERWPEYKTELGDPYPTIGEKAVGRWVKGITTESLCRIPVSILSHITLLGCGVVFILLISKFLQQMLPNQGISFCVWVLILTAILMPVSFLGSPHDFWFMAVAALATTVIACVIALVVMAQDYTNIAYQPTVMPALSFKEFFLALSTFSFAFGGSSTFPSFQNDMKNRNKFQKAVVIAYGILLVMFLSVGVSGFLVYGDRNTSNILETLSSGYLRNIAQFLLIAHLFTAFQIMINTPCQEYEQMLGVPRVFSPNRLTTDCVSEFTWKRVAVRTTVMIVIAFVCLSIPEFGKILNLVGAIAANTTTFVLPAIFYIYLCSQRTDPSWPDRYHPSLSPQRHNPFEHTECALANLFLCDRRISIFTKIYLWIIILMGVFSGIIGTYAAFSDIVDPTAFSKPCYLTGFMG